MTDHRIEFDPYQSEQPVLLSHVAATLRRYRVVILLALCAVLLGYLIIATTLYLTAQSQAVAATPFRLTFDGATLGQYPNGLKFTVADITATPVLAEVFENNDLKRFIGFERFSRAIYVLESNRTLERLTAEYQTKLADPKLSPLDRERLEQEYESKRASISKSDYAIQFLLGDDARAVPHSLVRKTLSDILDVWARRTAIEKRVLDYQVPVLSTNILEGAQIREGAPLISLLLLRRRVDDIKANLEAVSRVPGAQIVRTAKEKASVEDLRLSLDEVVRFRLEPLIATARASGQLGESSAALQILKAQLAYDERVLTAAKMREEALRNTLLTYESEDGAGDRVTDRAASRPIGDVARGAGETIMPQLSESFVDRIVQLTNRNADREFRQKLTNEIKEASLDIIPAEASVRYDRELIEAFQQASTRPDPAAAAGIDREWRDLLDHVRTVVLQINEIHQLASRQLNPSTELFRVTGPTSFRVDRTSSPRRLAVTGLIVFLLSIPLIITGVFIHNRVQEEEESEQSARRTESAAAR